MNALWKRIGGLKTRISSLEEEVLGKLAPQGVSERVTPFIESATVNFTFEEDQPKDIVLVQSANQITKISELSYAVHRDFVVSTTTMYPEAEYLERGYFDFQWNFQIGSTERNYVANQTEFGSSFLDRTALGDLNNSNCLLFSQKEPLVLATNEFLKIRVMPARFVNTAGDFKVTLYAAGWRVMSED